MYASSSWSSSRGLTQKITWFMPRSGKRNAVALNAFLLCMMCMCCCCMRRKHERGICALEITHQKKHRGSSFVSLIRSHTTCLISLVTLSLILSNSIRMMFTRKTALAWMWRMGFKGKEREENTSAFGTTIWWALNHRDKMMVRRAGGGPEFLSFPFSFQKYDVLCDTNEAATQTYTESKSPNTHKQTSKKAVRILAGNHPWNEPSYWVKR